MNNATLNNPLDELKRAVAAAGGQTQLAAMINDHLPSGVKPVTQKNVWAWLNRSGRISPEHALPCEMALSGQVTASKLRPDLYPNKSAEAAQ